MLKKRKARPARLRVGHRPAPLLNFTMLHSHMLSPVSGHGANFKVGCVHRSGAKTIRRGGGHQSLSTARRAGTGNSLEGTSERAKHILQTSSSWSWFSGSAEVEDSPGPQTALRKQAKMGSQPLTEIKERKKTHRNISGEVIKYCWWWINNGAQKKIINLV